MSMMFVFMASVQQQSNPYTEALKHASELHDKLSKLESFDWFLNSQWWWESSVNSVVNRIETYNKRVYASGW
jgi:hypothetical protein